MRIDISLLLNKNMLAAFNEELSFFFLSTIFDILVISKASSSVCWSSLSVYVRTGPAWAIQSHYQLLKTNQDSNNFDRQF